VTAYLLVSHQSFVSNAALNMIKDLMQKSHLMISLICLNHINTNQKIAYSQINSKKEYKSV